MRVILTSVMLVVFLLSGTGCFSMHPAFYEPNGFDVRRSPFDDLDRAKKLAAATDRRIILYVGGDWCAWCRYWSYFLKERPAINERLHETYVVVPVAAGTQKPYSMPKKFLEPYPRIKAMPSFVILESDGTFVHVQDSSSLADEEAYLKFDDDKAMDFIRRWSGRP